jgi:hypothetical protein
MNAWDLIRYNYPGLADDLQVAAREVNWYLEHYVGCKRLTPNQRNYVFSSDAVPGEIWLPDMPNADVAARFLVLSTLRGPFIGRMTFAVGRIHIYPRDYEKVAAAIEAGSITVKADPTVGHIAYYNPATNRITLSPELRDRGLIVHEATHAIFDIRALFTRVEESEGVAYVAQMLYGRFANPGAPRYIVSADPGHPMSWAAWQEIFDQSSRLAQQLTKNPTATDDDAADLYRAIRNANLYQGRLRNLEVNDGVP